MSEEAPQGGSDLQSREGELKKFKLLLEVHYHTRADKFYYPTPELEKRTFLQEFDRVIKTHEMLEACVVTYGNVTITEVP